MSPRWSRLDGWCLAGLAAAVLMFFWPLLAGRFLYCEDFVPFYHLRMPLWHMGQEGRLIWWTPCEFGGCPLLGDFQRGLFYPGSVCFYWLPPGRSISAHTIFHFLWCAWGMFVLGRLRGFSRVGAVTASVAFTWSFWMVFHAGGLPLTACTSWLPWVLAGLLHLLRGGPGAGLGLTFGMLCLTGYPQVIQLTLVIIAALGAIYARRAGWRGCARVALALILGGLLSAAQTLPAFYGTTLTLRSQGVSVDVSSSYALTPTSLWTAVSPYCHGITGKDPGEEPGPLFRAWRSLTGTAGVDETYRGDWSLQEMNVYPGLIVWLLALLALRSRRREVWVLWLAVVLSYWIALGERGGLFIVWTKVVPLAGLFRGPVRVAMVGALALSLLAGRGLESVRAPSRWALAAGLTILWGAAPHPAGLWGLLALSPLVLLVATAVMARAAWAVPVLLFLELACLGQGYLRTNARVVPPVDLSRLKVLAGEQRVVLGTGPPVPGQLALWSTVYDLRSLQGWNPIVPARLVELLYFSEGGGFPDQAARDRLVASNYLFVIGQPAGPLMRLLGARFILREKILENPAAQPLCWLAPEARLEPDGQKNLGLVRSGQVDPSATVLLSEGTPESFAGPAGTVESIRDRWDVVEVECTLTNPAWLATSIVAERGWTAWVDGVAQRPVRAFHALQAIKLSPGSHRVIFRYRPPYLGVGLGLSVLGLLGLIWQRKGRM